MKDKILHFDEVPFLWSHRKMKDFQKTEIMAMEAVGIRKHVIINVLQCRYGGYGEVGIIRKDAYNFSSRTRDQGSHEVMQ